MDKKIKIMLVEDDETLANEINIFLQRWGFSVYIARDFQNLLSVYMNTAPHLILMDVNLPYYDGFYWCRKIRETSNVPIIYISSRNDDLDKIMGMAQGGDDYVEKPFHLELLKAKIEAILRRTYQYKVNRQTYITAELYFQPSSSSLCYKGEELEITKSERKIITILLEKKGDVVSRDEMMMALWNTDEYVSDGTLTTLISRLRSKIKLLYGDELIQTKKGQGYYIE